MSQQRVVRGSTTSLLTYPRLAPGGDLVLGVPSSATVRVGTSRVALPTSGDAATVDPMSATVQGAHEEGSTHLTSSASKSWVRGRQYLVDTDGVIIVVRCGKTSTGTTLYLDTPLTADVANGATISGWAITHALTTDETADVGAGVAEWTATVGGVVYAWTDLFRVVRRVTTLPITPPDLVAAYPQILRLQGVTDATLDGLIAAAWEYRVLPRLATKGVRDEDIVDSEVLRPWLALACLVHAVAQDESASQQWRESLTADLDRTVDATLARVDWYEHDQETDPTPTLAPSTPRRLGITARL